MSIKTLTKYTLYGTPSLPPTHGHYNKKDRTGLGANSMKRFSVRMVQNNAVGIYTLSYSCTCWSSHRVNHFFGSSGAKDQLPGY